MGARSSCVVTELSSSPEDNVGGSGDVANAAEEGGGEEDFLSHNFLDPPEAGEDEGEVGEEGGEERLPNQRWDENLTIS